MRHNKTDPGKVEKSLHSDNLTAKQTKAIPIILKADSMEAAAKEAKVKRATIYRWLKIPDFKQRLEEARSEVFEDGLNRLKTATDRAAKTMIKLLDSKNENTRRLSSKDIINLAFKSVEDREIRDRIERLEEIINIRDSLGH